MWFNAALDVQHDVHTLTTEAVLSRFGVTLPFGLSASEAEARRTGVHGPNLMAQKSDWHPIIKFGFQLVSGFAPLLWVSALLVFIAWEPLDGGEYNFALGWVLVAVIFIQAIFSFYQEWQNNKVVATLKHMLPQYAVVRRDGMEISVPTPEITVGDILLLHAGDQVPADVRLLQCRRLRSDNAALTGESEPVRCTIAPCYGKTYVQATNMLFFGTSIVEGAGVGVVVAIGEQCEMARVMQVSLRAKAQMSALAWETLLFAVTIFVLSVVIGLAVFIGWIAWLRVAHPNYMRVADAVVNIVSIIVAFVPEGLPLALTLALVLIAKRLCKKYSVVTTKLGNIETLGAVSIICFDKTGTLTMNEMTVVNLTVGVDAIPITQTAQMPQTEALQALLAACTLCNATRLTMQSSQRQQHAPGDVLISGNGIDVALYKFVEKHSPGSYSTMRSRHPEVACLPFTPQSRTSVSVCKYANPRATNTFYTVFCKGALDVLLDRCSHIIASDGSATLITDAHKSFLNGYALELGREAKRVIAVAELPLQAETFAENYVFDSEAVNFPTFGMTLLGVVGIADPPREHVSEVIQQCRAAHARVMMLTGDHASTALAIGRVTGLITHDVVDTIDDLQVSEKPLTLARTPSAQITSRVYLLEDTAAQGGDDDAHSVSIELSYIAPVKSRAGGKNNSFLAHHTNEEMFHPGNDGRFHNIRKRTLLLTGKDLLRLSRKQWDAIILYDEIIFARASPEQKLEVVKAFQQGGHAVALLGDGINDAPGLKQADVGITMRSGAEVCKEAADVVLAGDDLRALVHGIYEGRLAFANLKKVIAYLLPAGTWSQVLPLVAHFFFGIPLPLSPFLMIVICMFTDLCGSVTMILEKPEADLHVSYPRNKRRDRLVDWRLLVHCYLFMGNLQSLAAFVNFFWNMTSAGNISVSTLIYAWDWGTEGYAGLTAAAQQQLLSDAQSAYFMTLVVCQLSNLLSNRRRRVPYFFNANKTPEALTAQRLISKRLIAAVVVELFIVVIVTCVPTFNSIFATSPVGAKYWAAAFGFALLTFLIGEARKWCIVLFPNSFIAKVAW